MEDILSKLGFKYGTDKVVHHQFTPFYNHYLEPHRNEFEHVMEIGVLNNSSLQMWEEYFPNATIVGVDNQVKKHFEGGRRKIFLADQSIPSHLLSVIENTTNDYDLIIDDGSHLVPHQYITLATLFKHVKPGGYYILEDLHCNYFPKWPEWHDHNVVITPLEALKSLKSTKKLIHQYISEEDALYIEDNTEWVEIFDRNGEYDSITAIIKKK